MPTTRISNSTHQLLRKLAERSGESMQALLDKAVELYRRQRFLEESNRAFEALRADASAWKAEQAERQLWNVTVADGLEKE